MRQLPFALQVYITAVMLAGGLVLAGLAFQIPATNSQQRIWALVATGAIALAETRRIPISYRSTVTVTSGISFATILLLGMALATWTSALGMAVASAYFNFYLKRRKWYNGLFNIAVVTLSTATTALIYRITAGQQDTLLMSWQNGLALVLAGLTYFLINSGLVAFAVALRRYRDPWYTWKMLIQQTALPYLTLMQLGVLIAVISHYRWWAVLLVVPAIFVVYQSLRMSQDLRVQTIEAVLALADTVDSRDPYTVAHSQRVAEYAEAIAQELRLPAEEIDMIALSARVHDLGKIGIEDALLFKPGPFTWEEKLSFQRHVQIGCEIVERFPRYQEGREIILCHHEHYDGSGYLRGLRGEAIPLGARIIAVADAYDAMTSDRPYRRALSSAAAVEELIRCSGTQFDPQVVQAFLRVLQRRHEIEQAIPFQEWFTQKSRVS